MKEFDKRNVELLPDKIDLMTDTELSQYFMKSWTLDFKDPGNVDKQQHANSLKTFRYTFKRAKDGDSVQKTANK